jgi:cytochrome c oxidase assembly protein subunit 15
MHSQKGSLTPGIARFAWAVLVYNFAVIVWGGYVRASGSGAGCGSHWPLCDGVVVPRDPDIKMMIELSHRVTSMLAGILVFALVVWVFRTRAAGDPVRRTAVASGILIVVEGLIGAGLVLYGWVDKDTSLGRVVSHGLHFGNTLLLLAALTLTAWRLSGAPANRWRGEGLDGGLIWTMFALTFFVAIAGAVTALGDTLFPAETLAQGIRNDLLPTAHFLERLRVVHPVVAVMTTIAVIRGALLLRHRRPSPSTQRLGTMMCAVIIGQVAVGVVNLALAAPISLQLVHLFMADTVWVTLVLLSASALATPPLARV